MTGDELQAALDTIGWSRLALSKRVGVAQTTVEQWRKGDTRIPPDVGRWLTRLAAFHDKHPPPVVTPRPKEGPLDQARLDRLRRLVEQEGKTLAAAAVAMKEHPKTLRNFATRHGVSPRSKA